MSAFNEPDMDTSAEEGLVAPRTLEARRPWAKRAGLGGALALGLAGAALVASRGMGVSIAPSTGESFEQGLQQKDVVATVPARVHCSQKNTDCSTLKCCQTSGYKCFSKDSSYATCRATCNPATDGSCIELNNGWAYKPANTTLATKMYCFATYVVDMGPDKTKPNYDLSLLRTQLRFGVGLFGCTKWEVFSDQETELSPGPPVKLWASVIKDLDGEFHKFTRIDKPYKWVNTPFYYQVWQAIRHNSRHMGTDWVVKVDPATVFMPEKLAAHLATRSIPPEGAYFENCKGVDSGFFGNLEVMSFNAFNNSFLPKLEDCKLNLCWDGKKDCENWKFGPWGEDKFMQECFDRQSVSKIEDFKLSTSGTCPHDRPKAQKQNKKFVPDCATVTTPAVHPFRTPTAWFGCLATILKKDFSQ